MGRRETPKHQRAASEVAEAESPRAWSSVVVVAELTSDDRAESEVLGLLVRQVLEGLRWAGESHCHLPHTECGHFLVSLF